MQFAVVSFIFQSCYYLPVSNPHLLSHRDSAVGYLIWEVLNYLQNVGLLLVVTWVKIISFSIVGTFDLEWEGWNYKATGCRQTRACAVPTHLTIWTNSIWEQQP